ncbi:MAG: tetratricopeptide repeat protein, partial [Myxococcales bacterium]|nr:tetratricopeptide repeat protein [Myxococcales bacterium]
HVLQRSGRHVEALAVAGEVTTAAEQLGDEPLLVRARIRLGSLQDDAAAYESAETTLTSAYESALGQTMMAEAATAANLLTQLIGYKLARIDEGRWWLGTARPLARAADSDDAQIGYYDNLGILSFMDGHYEAAREAFAASLAIEEQVWGADHPRIAGSLNNLGVVAALAGDDERARADFEGALRIYTATLGPEHPKVATTLNHLGGVESGEQARAHLERALAIRERSLGPDHPEVASVLTTLAAQANDDGRLQDALDYQQRALAIQERQLGSDHPDVAVSLCNLGLLALELERFEEARAHFERALTIQERELGPDHVALAGSLRGLGLALLGLGVPAEALPPLERAWTLAHAGERDPAMLAAIEFALARALWQAPAGSGGDPARARALANAAETGFVDAGGEWAPELEALRSWRAGLPEDP